MALPVVDDTAYGIIPILPPTDREGHRYLLILHNKGHWGFPKGHRDPHAEESDVQAAERELQEETGITGYELLEDCELTEHYRFTSPDGVKVRKQVLYFVAMVASTESGDPPKVRVQPEEIRDFRWCSFDQALALFQFEEARHLLRNCEQHLQSYFRTRYLPD